MHPHESMQYCVASMELHWGLRGDRGSFLLFCPKSMTVSEPVRFTGWAAQVNVPLKRAAHPFSTEGSTSTGVVNLQLPLKPAMTW